MPAGAMQYPVFHRTLPPYANLATLGSMLGNEVVQAVDEGGALMSRAGPGLSPLFSLTTQTSGPTSTSAYRAALPPERHGVRLVVSGHFESVLRRPSVRQGPLLERRRRPVQRRGQHTRSGIALDFN